MAIHFKTFGPFELGRTAGVVNSSGLSVLWNEVNHEHVGLSKGVGVYLIAARRGDQLIPWYVGKSDNGFKGRLKENHHAFQLLSQRQPKGSLQIFLFAKVTAKRGTLNKRPKKRYVEQGEDFRAKRKPRKSISKLEFILIGSCLSCNPDLVNAKEAVFHSGLVVPGYFNDDQSDISESSTSLRNMLGH